MCLNEVKKMKFVFHSQNIAVHISRNKSFFLIKGAAFIHIFFSFDLFQVAFEKK